CFNDTHSPPLDHQEASETRMVKGNGRDRYRSLPSLLPSETHIFAGAEDREICGAATFSTS
ncbi:MAG TPA: hypothetical protein VGC24_02950, partial [Burkholderiaceae bacterium]